MSMPPELGEHESSDALAPPGARPEATLLEGGGRRERHEMTPPSPWVLGSVDGDRSTTASRGNTKDSLARWNALCIRQAGPDGSLGIR